jgi:hypothetical protein
MLAMRGDSVLPACECGLLTRAAILPTIEALMCASAPEQASLPQPFGTPAVPRWRSLRGGTPRDGQPPEPLPALAPRARHGSFSHSTLTTCHTC